MGMASTPAMDDHASGYSSGILLKNVQSPVTGEARVRTPVGDRVEHRIMARGVASDPETHQELEGWT